MQHVHPALRARRRHAHAFTLALAILLMAAPDLAAQWDLYPDIMIADCPSDIGSQPNPYCNNNLQSPDIYIRNRRDGMHTTVFQNPIGGQTNWVYVKLKNRRSQTLNNGVLKVYFAKSTAGMSWPGSWINNVKNGVVYGDIIGTANVTNVGPNATVTVEIPWQNVPDPRVYNDNNAHFCILARFDSPEDPVGQDLTAVVLYAKNNNNVAYRNTSILNPVKPKGALDITNIYDVATRTKLKFAVASEQLDDPVLNHATITVDLGQDLFGLWNDGGRQGSGITYTGETSITINDADAWIGGITLAPLASHTLHVEASNFDDNPSIAGTIYRWSLSQHEDETEEEEFLGSEEYYITMPRPDVMIRDCAGDVGTEPSSSCGSVLWASPAIYIRNQQDGLVTPVHQSPVAGINNWAYVQVENIGTAASNGGTVYLYFAKASTGLSWPSDWTGPYPYGSLIGTASVGALGVNGTTTVEIPWNNVPDPSQFSDSDARHFCLLARYVSSDDPMTSPELASVPGNTLYNNNIAWKNVTIMDGTYPRAAVDVLNGTNAELPVTLQFDVPEEEDGDPVLGHATVKVDLGQSLTDFWITGGSQGAGIIYEDGTTVIEITDPHAWIGGLNLAAQSRYNMHVEISNLDGSDALYHWTISQYTGSEADGNLELLGGEMYDIDVSNSGFDKRSTPLETEEGNLFNLTARPNPAHSTATIGYMLASNTTVTLAIYDANGRLVRTLLANAALKAGHHEVEWDGNAVDGKAVPGGTYLYHLSTPLGSMESQVKIVR